MFGGAPEDEPDRRPRHPGPADPRLEASPDAAEQTASLVELRIAVEPEAARLAARRASSAQIAELVAMPLTDLAAALQPAANRADFEAAYESIESGEFTEVATMIAADLVARIQVLVDLGLG